MSTEQIDPRIVTSGEIYHSIVQRINEAENITWNRFYNFLMFNTVMILAWSTVYAADPHPRCFRLMLAAMCITGGASGVFWAALGYRGRTFLKAAADLGKRIEDDPAMWPVEFANYKPVGLVISMRDSMRFAWSGSFHLLIGGPIVVTLLYILMLVVSLL